MKKRHFEQQPQEPWGQSHRPVPPPDVGRKRHRRKHSGFALFLMVVGFVTLVMLAFRFLIVPILVMANGGI